MRSRRHIQPSTSRTQSARLRPHCTTNSRSSHQERSDMVTLAEVQAGIAIGEAIVAAIVKVAPAIQQGVVSSLPYAQAIAGLLQGSNATPDQIDAPLAQINSATDKFMEALPPDDGSTTT